MAKVTQKEIIEALRDASSYAFYRDLSELADRIERYGISEDQSMVQNELGNRWCKMKWVVEIKFPTKTPIWVGTIRSESRADAKKMARRFVSAHFPSNVKILRIARGFMSLVLESEPELFDSDDE